MESNRIESNRMEWNGMEWNRIMAVSISDPKSLVSVLLFL
jgi:hypothetical protein